MPTMQAHKFKNEPPELRSTSWAFIKFKPSIPFVKYCPHKIETEGSRLPGSTKSEKIYSETLSTMLFDLFGDGMYRSLYTGSMPTQMPPHAYAEWKRWMKMSLVNDGKFACATLPLQQTSTLLLRVPAHECADCKIYQNIYENIRSTAYAAS